MYNMCITYIYVYVVVVVVVVVDVAVAVIVVVLVVVVAVVVVLVVDIVVVVAADAVVVGLVVCSAIVHGVIAHRLEMNTHPNNQKQTKCTKTKQVDLIPPPPFFKVGVDNLEVNWRNIFHCNAPPLSDSRSPTLKEGGGGQGISRNKK